MGDTLREKDRKERDIAVDFCSDPIYDSHFSEKIILRSNIYQSLSNLSTK